MSNIVSREIHLSSFVTGIPSPTNFELVRTELDHPRHNEVLVRNLFMSVDPYMRGRMSPSPSYAPPFELNKPLNGAAIGEVVVSKSDDFHPGDIVTSNSGWREYFIASPADLRAVSRDIEPLSVYLGALGMTGMTAWVGLNLADIKSAETIYISGAAGAVGSVAGQLAKLRGCYVIGSAGTPAKVALLQEEFGFDHAFNYHDSPVLEQLRKAAPDGIDVYFDNVGGEALEAALSALRIHGRIITCGAISSYNNETSVPGPSNLSNMISKRLTMQGFIVSDWIDHRSDFEFDLGGYLRSGNLKNRETVVQGIGRAVEAFIGLFEGSNVGKMIVQLAPSGGDIK